MSVPSAKPTIPSAEHVEAPLRVVIVGAGPKGLQALGHLVQQASARGVTALEVTLVDPRPAGTGAAYDPSQPEQLRLNVSAAICHQPPLPPLPEWAVAQGTALGVDVPRALVGRYLAQAFDALVAQASFPVTQRIASVVSCQRRADGWHLGLDDSTALDADQVLLATGHAPDWDGALAHGWRCGLPLVPGVYSVSRLDALAPGSRVAVRGAALTFIDLVLTLQARPETQRPSVILPTGRSGALLAAKPVALADPLDTPLPDEPAALVEAVIDLATELWGRMGRASRTEVAATLATGWEADLREPFPGRAVEALARSIDVAHGRRAPGPAWALGRVWSARYPDVVRALSGGHPGPGWPVLARAAAVLERLTFGPPLANAERLLAACDDGFVDTSWLDAGVRIDADGLHGLPFDAPPPDVVVDAVLPPPGARAARTPLLDVLLADGTLQLADDLRGIMADADGFAAPGLALVGRPLEDVVVGNDTLSATLHDVPERWAARVLEAIPSIKGRFA